MEVIKSSRDALFGEAPLLPLSVLSLATGGVVCKSQCPTHLISEDSLRAALDKNTASRSSILHQPSPHAFTPYHSPLLNFQSYRLNTHYRTQSSLPLSSLTHSHCIKPRHIMCRYELQGQCRDTKCPAQHFKSITPSTDQLIENLSSYTSAGGGATGVKEELSSYRGKVSSEELLQLAVHMTRKSLESSEAGLSCGLLDLPQDASQDEESDLETRTTISPVMVVSGDSHVMSVDSERYGRFASLLTT